VQLTRKGYENSLKRIAVCFQRERATAHLVRVGERGVELDVEKLTTQDVLRYFQGLKNSGRSVASLANYRSSLAHVYKETGAEKPDDYDEEVSQFFAGARRDEASERQAGKRKAQPGKEPLAFSLYQWLARRLLTGSVDPFGHCFQVLMWNMMCRANNVAKLCFSHLRWHEDALQIAIPKTKADQTGERNVEPKHVYANPGLPEICPVLALALYFVCHSEPTDEQVFYGGSQQWRFNKFLKMALRDEEARAMLRLHGLKVDELGAHSTRKGSGKYACGGSSGGGPSIVSVSLRCGWSLGDTMERYLRYEGAGDQFVGRVVSGHPLHSPLFAALPPHFAEVDADLLAAMRRMFPIITCTEGMQLVLLHCMASLVHHYDWLRSNLHQDHAFFQCVLVRDSLLLRWLQGRLVREDRGDRPAIRPTGVPPHVAIMRQVADQHQAARLATAQLEAAVRAIPVKISDLRVDLVSDIECLLDRKHLEAGMVTPANVNMAIQGTLEGFLGNLRAEFSGLRNTETSASDPACSGAVVDDGENDEDSDVFPELFYEWEGEKRSLPDGFTFPRVHLYTGWELWWRGNKGQGIPPYRALSTRDCSALNTRKRLSDWRAVYCLLETLLPEEDLPQTALPESRLLPLFQKATEHLPRDHVNKYKRRWSAVTVLTLCRLLRQWRKEGRLLGQGEE
jgi:hypothetical protein